MYLNIININTVGQEIISKFSTECVRETNSYLNSLH